MDLKLKDKVVIVTGGTSGIGEAIVHGFADENACLVIVGRNEERGKEVQQKVQDKGVESIFVKADLTDRKACEEVVSQSLAKFGKIDVLVNNAGHNDGAGLTASIDDFVHSLHKNLVHYFILAKYCREPLIKTKGCIVNIGSKVANTGQGGSSGYAASKGGIQALTREWAVAMLPYEVRVNEVVPAETWTPQYESWVSSFPNHEEKLEEITRRIPLGKRMTTAQEIADFVVFVSSDRASHLTGQHLYVDGGYTHLDRSIGT